MVVYAFVFSFNIGYYQVCVKEVLAQAPIQVKMHLENQQNLNYEHLVPGAVIFKPQENGEIMVEVSSLTVNVFAVVEIYLELCSYFMML